MIGIIVMLSVIIIATINPMRQLEGARDSQRKAHLSVIHGAIMEFSGRNEGDFPGCVGGTQTNVTECSNDLVPVYLEEIPEDPSDGCSYFVKESPAGRVGVKAECVEVEEEITVGDWVE